MTEKLSGRIVTPDRVIEGAVILADGRIDAIEPGSVGISIVDAALLAATTPARILGLGEVSGSECEPGSRRGGTQMILTVILNVASRALRRGPVLSQSQEHSTPDLYARLRPDVTLDRIHDPR